MNQRIVIKNFGPIKHVDLPIADYTLFIGPNASGKSTIAKLVYFCQEAMVSIGNYATEMLLKNIKEFDDTLFDGTHTLFAKIWDIESLQNDFEVHFYSSAQDTTEQRIVSIQKHPCEKNKIQIAFNDDFVGILYAERVPGQEIPELFNFPQLIAVLEINTWLLKNNMAEGLMFIPAGRQAFAIPKDERPTFSQDFFMKWFYEHTIEQKKNFREPISQKIKGIKEGGFPERQVECLELAQDLTSKILKGEYVSPRDDERIYIDNDQYVKLYEASSGQQEALWILNSVYSSIEQKKQKRFTIIEEPEAHLYPETQRDVTNLISLLANQTGNQVMLTTHSPYILSALNNLLYAHKVGKTKPDEMAKVIDPLLWVDIDRVAAYVVEDGTIRSIIDHDLGIINAQEIDSASRIIADEFEQILEVEG